jgi:tripartite-type tricarboxylate transporter receptor subunit TctC
MNTKHVPRIAACLLLAWLSALAQAQNFPSRPIRFVVPIAPGGGADLVARVIAERLSRNLGQQVVVENRAGGGTVIGTESVARSAADGYTWLLGTATSHAINASLLKKLPYDPVKDFAPIALVAVLPQIIVIHPALPATSLKDFIALAKKRPGEILFGSPGNGSNNQLGAEMLNIVTGIKTLHVPYKGAGPAITDLLAGHLQYMFTTVPPALPQVKAGRLRALAVASAKRSTLLPDLPTTAEQGARGVEAASWNGILLPAGAPREIITRLHAEIGAVMKQPEVIERLAGAGVEPAMMTPEEFAAYIESETARYAKVVKASGAKLD